MHAFPGVVHDSGRTAAWIPYGKVGRTGGRRNPDARPDATGEDIFRSTTCGSALFRTGAGISCRTHPNPPWNPPFRSLEQPRETAPLCFSSTARKSPRFRRRASARGRTSAGSGTHPAFAPPHRGSRTKTEAAVPRGAELPLCVGELARRLNLVRSGRIACIPGRTTGTSRVGRTPGERTEPRHFRSPAERRRTHRSGRRSAGVQQLSSRYRRTRSRSGHARSRRYVSHSFRLCAHRSPQDHDEQAGQQVAKSRVPVPEGEPAARVNLPYAGKSSSIRSVLRPRRFEVVLDRARVLGHPPEDSSALVWRHSAGLTNPLGIRVSRILITGSGHGAAQ